MPARRRKRAHRGAGFWDMAKEIVHPFTHFGENLQKRADRRKKRAATGKGLMMRGSGLRLSGSGLRLRGGGLRLRGGGLKAKHKALRGKHYTRIRKVHKAHQRRVDQHHKRAAGKLANHFAQILKHTGAFTGIAAQRAAKATYGSAKAVLKHLMNGKKPPQPKGMTRKGAAGWGFLSKVGDWFGNQWKTHRHHVDKLANDAMDHVKGEAKKMGKAAFESGKAYVTTEGKKLLAHGKRTAAQVKASVQKKAKHHVDKFATAAKNKVASYTKKVSDKISSVGNSVNKYTDF